MSDYNWDSTPAQKAELIYQRGYREGVEDMKRGAFSVANELASSPKQYRIFLNALEIEANVLTGDDVPGVEI